MNLNIMVKRRYLHIEIYVAGKADFPSNRITKQYNKGVVFLAEYKVVEVTQFDAGVIHDGSDVELSAHLSEFCPAGWEIVSARMMADNGIQRALVLLSR